ncbi:phage minor tail protein G [Aggregatibacter actinomycetemcomitans]|uniref:phage minor tail protein G n=1 Tax=Aggregatibacter actinomycetemcomitans TaxID=714 RepID=UPI002150761A|nr:phage minor tail protein G [Aggregatibacter actinomycetemcomitans]
MLKKVKFELRGETLELSALSALDYLDYVEYLNSLEKPAPVAESDTEQELNSKLNKITRNNMMAHSRLIAASLSYASEKSIEELQKEVLTTCTQADIFRVLEAVQDVCEFPKAEQGESEPSDGDEKNA